MPIDHSQNWKGYDTRPNRSRKNAILPVIADGGVKVKDEDVVDSSF